MKCTELPGGGFSCGRREHHWCSSCKSARATKQCDHPIKRRAGIVVGYPNLTDPHLSAPMVEGTCDRWLCERCAVNVGPNRDYCPAHARMSREAKPEKTP